MGAASCAQILRRMAAQLGQEPLSEAQLAFTKTLAESLVAYTDQACAFGPLGYLPK